MNQQSPSNSNLPATSPCGIVRKVFGRDDDIIYSKIKMGDRLQQIAVYSLLMYFITDNSGLRWAHGSTDPTEAPPGQIPTFLYISSTSSVLRFILAIVPPPPGSAQPTPVT